MTFTLQYENSNSTFLPPPFVLEGGSGQPAENNNTSFHSQM